MPIKLSHAITQKAERVIYCDDGSAIVYTMVMNRNLGNSHPNATPAKSYAAMVSFTRSQLEDSGQFTAEELDKVDYDSFVEPFVDEIDRFEDSYHLQIAKQQIMGILRSHLPKDFED